MAKRKKKPPDPGRLATAEETDTVWNQPVNATSDLKLKTMIKDAKQFHKNSKPKQLEMFK